MADLVTIIVNYRLADQIEELLASGALNGSDVMLVDNASQPERIAELADRHGTEHLLLDRNYGFAGAVNRAVAACPRAPADILLLNPDVRLTAATVTTLRRARRERALTGVAPVLVSPDGSVQIAAGGPVTLRSFGLYFLLVSHVFRRSPGVLYTRGQVRRGLVPEWVGMGCVLLSGDAFARFGPIPEDELVYAEDVAWGTAATQRGARFAVLAGVAVTHEQGAAGASALWTSALGRLAVRRLGPVRGRLAVLAMSGGLGLRSLAGRRIGPRRHRPVPVLSPSPA